MRKPTKKMVWRGVKGNQWRSYDVKVDGKTYTHQNKTDALRQYNAAMRVYKKRKK